MILKKLGLFFSFKIRIGDNNHNSASDDDNLQVLDIFKSFIHPNYKKSTAYYDVAILQTKESIEFSNSIGPICLPKESSEDIHRYDHRYVELIGWGSKHKLAANSPRLRRVSLNVYSNR